MYYPQEENKLMRQIVSQARKINSETIVYALLFLFPVFAVTVRHWASGFFGLLALMALIQLFRKNKQSLELSKEEKVLLWGFVFFFVVFVLLIPFS